MNDSAGNCWPTVAISESVPQPPEDGGKHVSDGVYHLVVMELERHLEIEADKLGQMPVSDTVLCPEPSTNGKDLEENSCLLKILSFFLSYLVKVLGSHLVAICL